MRKRTLALWAAAGAGVAIVLTLLAVLTLTRSEWGQERVRRFTVSWLEERVEGALRVGRMSSERSLFGAVTLHDFSIDDPSGRPFVRADSARLEYDWLTFVSGEVVLDRLELFGTELVIERLPGWDRWNYERSLEGPDAEPGPEGARRLILIQEASLRSADVVVRFPMDPDEPVTPEDTARILVEEFPGGLVRVMRFEDLQAELPRLLVESPEGEGRLFEIASLTARAHVWETPIDVQALEGTVTVRDSLVSFDVPRLRLPSSLASMVGQVTITDEGPLTDLRVSGDTVALRDVQWLFPDLPEEGGGRLVFHMQSQGPDRTLFFTDSMDVRTPGSHVMGSFGVVTGDTLFFTRVALRASPLDVGLLEAILPGDLPVDGLLVGTVEVEGPLSALRTRGDLRLVGRARPRTDPVRGPPRPAPAVGAPATRAPGSSSIRWSGTFDVRGGALRVRSGEATVDRLDSALVAGLLPGSRLPGGMTGTARLREMPGGGLHVDASLRRAIEGQPDLVVGAVGTVHGRGAARRLDFELRPREAPLPTLAALLGSGADLGGVLEGAVRVSGSPDRLRVAGMLETAGGGVGVDGQITLGQDPGYRGVLELEGFRLSEVVRGLPPTQLSGRVQLDGEGMAGARRIAVRAHLGRGRVGALDVSDGEARLEVRDGVLMVDTLHVRANAGELEAWGSLGLAAGRSGTLRWRLAADSLRALEPFVLPDTVLLSPEETAPRLAGAVHAEGTLSGRLDSLALTADGRLQEAVFRGFRAETGRVNLDLAGLRTDHPVWRVRSMLEDVALGRAHLTGLALSLDRDGATGTATFNAGGRSRSYAATAGFLREERGMVVDLQDLRLRSDRGVWSLADSARIRAGAEGLVVDGFDLRRVGEGGRIVARGVLPWGAGPMATGDFDLALENVAVAEILELVHSDLGGAGTVTGRLQLRGTAGDPRIEADATVARAGVDDMLLDRLYWIISYADQRLRGRVEARHQERTVLRVEGEVPVDLALHPVPVRRLARPLEVLARADSLPLGLITALLPGFQSPAGSLTGSLTAGGTTRDPALDGSVELSRGAVSWVPTGVRYRDVEASIRLSGRNTLTVTGRGRAGRGSAEVEGTVVLDPVADPILDLTLRPRAFELARRQDVELVGSGELHLTGSYRRPLVTGSLTAEGGSVNLDEIWRSYQVVELDEDRLLAVVDTSVVSVRPLLSASQHPFLKNLVVQGAVTLSRDVWLRSRQMNVEISGDLDVELDRRVQELRMSGSLDAVRGYYQLYGRRFEVQDGQVEFVGTPGFDPNLTITALYRSRTADNEPLDIQARLSGTLLTPRVTLASDTEPPISESDLVSYLIFGRPTYALASAEIQAFGRAGGRASNLGRLGALGLGAVTPSLMGFAATNLESVARSFGVADYLAIRPDELAAADPAQTTGFGGLFPAARFDVGWYLSQDVFLALSQRLVEGVDATEPAVRLEWRFRPTWTLEAFSEDRFADAPSIGLQSGLELQRVYGLFLFREWGY